MTHKFGKKGGAEFLTSAHGLLAFRQINGEKHDAFSEGRAQNGLDEDLRRRAGIAPDRFRSLHTNQAHADSRAERRQADVNITSHFITFRCSRRLPRLNTVKAAKLLNQC